MTSGFAVQPAQLTTFSGFIRDTTAPIVQDAASELNGKATGFDNNAFGLVLAQVMAIPARIALGVGADQLNGLKSRLENAATTTDTTASNYQNSDQQNAQSFTNLNGSA